MSLHRLALVSLAAVCTAFPPGAHADDAELRALRRQVQELTNAVRQLQERVNALEKGDASTWIPATAPSTIATPDRDDAPQDLKTPAAPERVAPGAKASVDDKVVMLRNSWRRISKGMKQEDVMEALGPPTKEMMMNGKVVWYYYYAGLGAGSVFFNSDGRSSSSQPPNVGWNF